MSDLDEQILETYQALRRKEKITLHLTHLNARIRELRMELVGLKRVVDREYKDIERLQKLSLRRLFRSVLKDREAQLELNRQEYLMAFLMWRDRKEELEALEFEQGILQERLDQFKIGAKIEDQLKSLIQRKLKTLVGFDQSSKMQLIDLKNQINQHTINIEQTEEAIIHGERVMAHFKELHEELRQVIGWGVFEMHGQGRYSSYAKKQYIKETKENISQLNQQIVKFRIELNDLYIDLDKGLFNFAQSFIDYHNYF